MALLGASDPGPHRVPLRLGYGSVLRNLILLDLDDASPDEVVRERVVIVNVEDEGWQVADARVTLNNWNFYRLEEDRVVVVLDHLSLFLAAGLTPDLDEGVGLAVVIR